ncbi:uncharacterized protein LOC132733636 [Ruditapes philippinarum]|uniref:uncharacterized protein LOC132733636 n=1 Tax=Ruditapes philippinarum TaxID=129788 RepID=UPI00295A8106|nr:uncharacterized protein LOC132733636 [Ruditapes philippinarum]
MINVKSISRFNPSECVDNYGPCIETLEEDASSIERTDDKPVVKDTLFNGPAVASQLIDHLQWKNAIIIYEEATVFEMSSLIGILSKKGIMSVLYHVNDLHKLFIDLTVQRTMFKPQWKTIVCFNMIVLCRYKCASKVIAQANEFDGVYNNNRTFLSSLSRWLFVLYGKSQAFLQSTKLHHVLVVHIPEIDSGNRKTFLSLLSRNLIDNDEGMTKTEIVHVIEKVSSPEYIYCEGCNLTTTVWTQTGLQNRTVGYVMPTGQVVIEEDLYPNLKYKYNKQTFFVSVIVYPPFIIKQTVNGVTKLTGFCIDILSDLAETLNFTYQLSEVPDGNYGMVVNKTTMAFNGLIGQVQRKARTFTTISTVFYL